MNKTVNNKRDKFIGNCVTVLVTFLLAVVALAFLSLILSGCATTKPIYERPNVKDLVLRPRAGYADQLTNKRCIERKHGTTECLKYDIKTFDLKDDAVRKLLRDLKFVCNVGNVQYGICPTARGLCQIRKEKSGWPFPKTETKLSKYLSAGYDYDFLIASDTYCASFNSEVGEQMFHED